MTVTLKRLDHVNIRTADLAGMIAWYGRVLDMHPGPRPGFTFPGAWLYADGHAIVHLVGVETAPGPIRPISGSNISRFPPMASRVCSSGSTPKARAPGSITSRISAFCR